MLYFGLLLFLQRSETIQYGSTVRPPDILDTQNTGFGSLDSLRLNGVRILNARVSFPTQKKERMPREI